MEKAWGDPGLFRCCFPCRPLTRLTRIWSFLPFGSKCEKGILPCIERSCLLGNLCIGDLVLLGNGIRWNHFGTVETAKQESDNEQTIFISQHGRITLHGFWMVVGVSCCGDLVAMEVILAWLWQFVLVGLLILVGYILKGRRKVMSRHGRYDSGDRLVPGHVELFRQRRRKRQLLFKRVSRLN